MTPYYDEDGITIYHGDCRELLPSLDMRHWAHTFLGLYIPEPNEHEEAA